MSQYTKKRSEKHKVTHIFSGKYHFFRVDSCSGESYGISIHLNCECVSESNNWNEKNSEICSHLLAVLADIVNNKGRIGKPQEKDGSSQERPPPTEPAALNFCDNCISKPCPELKQQNCSSLNFQYYKPK